MTKAKGDGEMADNNPKNAIKLRILPSDQRPNDKLIKLLERLLSDAKEGKLRDVAGLTRWSDGTIAHSWSGSHSWAGTSEILGEMQLMVHRYSQMIAESYDAVDEGEDL